MPSAETVDSERLVPIFLRLKEAVSRFQFDAPVSYVYNPLSYAWKPFELYLKRYVAGPSGRTLLLGMNPGPWGMAQTGIPFGEVASVRDWLGVSAPVSTPNPQHPSRPVEGFECQRSEVSGRRLWGLFSELYPQAEQFAQHFVVINYCPLVFMEESGRNRTPDKLPKKERDPLYQTCDNALSELIKALGVTTAIGVGRFAEQRLQTVSGQSARKLDVRSILHPSPANPKANADWNGSVLPVLKDLTTL